MYRISSSQNIWSAVTNEFQSEDIPSMSKAINPLLKIQQLPVFSEINPRHVQPAVDFVLAQNRRDIEQLQCNSGSASWETLVQPLEDMDDTLSRIWSPVSHLNAVKDSDALREEYEACLPKLAAYGTDLGQNERLFAGFKHIKASPEFDSLDRAQRKIIENALRDFHLMGVDLPASGKKRFKEIQQRLSTVGNQFDRNVLDATSVWHLHITDQDDLKGLPPSALDMAQKMAQQNDQSGWRFTLDLPSYLSFMMHADDRALRESMYEAYVTRASELGPDGGQYDNSGNMIETLELRQEMSKLLGFKDYAQLSLATKMADSPRQVIDFLLDLAGRARPFAEREFRQLREFASRELGVSEVQAWDFLYCSEKQKQSLYDFSEEDVRPYFPVEKVLNGMFEVVSRLYGLSIERVEDIDVWDPAVKFYQITDSSDRVRGQFYVDLYVRPHKRGGAWMDALANRKRDRMGVQVPVAFLTCNFSIPTKDKPALLTHDEVITLFHEFGHGLHHMLTMVDYVGVSGINGVVWDAVELPSQFMENWCWQSEALDLVGGHYETGDPLPHDLLDKLKRARNFQSGLQLLRQVELALYDMRLHLEFDASGEQSMQVLLDEVRRQVAVIIPPRYNRFESSFSHIFAGGYAAGYYSYLWAEVLSADAFSLFEERGLFDKRTGHAFLINILEAGGAVEALDAFVAFRGREPRIDALLRHSGLQDGG